MRWLNYIRYRRMMRHEYGGTIIYPASYQQWRLFNEAMDRIS